MIILQLSVLKLQLVKIQHHVIIAKLHLKRNNANKNSKTAAYESWMV